MIAAVQILGCWCDDVCRSVRNWLRPRLLAMYKIGLRKSCNYTFAFAIVAQQSYSSRTVFSLPYLAIPSITKKWRFGNTTKTVSYNVIPAVNLYLIRTSLEARNVDGV